MPKTGGRRPGSRNKVTGDIRQAVVEAANSGDGFHAWLVWLKTEHPKEFTVLLKACLPKEIKLNVQNTVELVRQMEERERKLQLVEGGEEAA